MKKGALVAPCVFVALAFAGAASSLNYVMPWAISALALAAACIAAPPTNGYAFSGLSIFALGYPTLAAASTLMIGAAYTPLGLYLPLLLVLGFLVAHRLDGPGLRSTLFAVTALGMALAAWGLVQIVLLGMMRAQAMLETPATFAAVMNLLLVSALSAVLMGKRSVPLFAIALLFAAGLFAADSRGGFLALAAGIGFAAILVVRARLLRQRSVGLVFAILAVGWIATVALRALHPPQPEVVPSETARAESSLSRLELYALSWNAWRERPLAGTGYLTFRYTLEQGRAQVPSYGEENETWFVHNDYLQTLQELGPLGLLAFLGLTVLPPLLAYRRLPTLAAEHRLPVIASASALAAMSVHALVDFPFYIPLCLLLYGVFLGVLGRRLDGQSAAAAPGWSAKPWYRPARAVALATAAFYLLRPVLAEAAAEWGMRKSAEDEGQSAAFWLGAAQRLDPRDWRYHWYAGQFWEAQAAQSGKREAARFAADAYAAGFAANPLEVRNLLGKISVHRRHRDLLGEPADPGVVQRWLAQAEALAPLNPAVKQERLR